MYVVNIHENWFQFSIGPYLHLKKFHCKIANKKGEDLKERMMNVANKKGEDLKERMMNEI